MEGKEHKIKQGLKLPVFAVAPAHICMRLFECREGRNILMRLSKWGVWKRQVCVAEVRGKK